MDPIFSYPQLPTQQCHLLAYTMYMHFPQPTRHPPDIRRLVHHPHNSLRQSRSPGEGLMPTQVHFRSYQAGTAHFPVSPLRFLPLRTSDASGACSDGSPATLLV